MVLFEQTANLYALFCAGCERIAAMKPFIEPTPADAGICA